MAAYPSSATDRRIQADALRTALETIFAATGMTAADAALLADTLVEADLEGVHSHGSLRTLEYVKKLQSGGVDPRGEPKVVSDRGGALVVDGGNSMGQIGSAFAMRQAIARAKESGIAAAAVRGSNHCGALAYYVKLAAAEGMVGIASTNALPTMAPWGGLDRILGINPLGVAIPAAEENPIVYDAAFSGSSHGKIRVFHQKGLPIPDAWAFDADGKPTTDAARAIDGLLLPIGGHKGVGLALVWGLLSSLLSGAAYGTELGDMESGPKAGRDGHIFLALNVGFFVDPQAFGRRVDAAIREIRGSRRAEGVERLYAPGEMELETTQKYEAEGIPLNAETLNGIHEAAALAGCEARL